MSAMKIGILGSGDVAKALAAGFLSRGHEVMLGTREASKLDGWRRDHPRSSAGSFAQTASFGEVAVLATLGSATVGIVTGAGAERFSGKVVIDATNPLTFEENAPPRLFVGGDDSLGERVARALPQARVVKAFNTVGHALMVDPKLAGGPPTMFIAGNDAAAKETVTGFLTAFGWETADLGGIEASRYLEAMCVAWVLYGVQTQTWRHAFKLLR